MANGGQIPIAGRGLTQGFRQGFNLTDEVMNRNRRSRTQEQQVELERQQASQDQIENTRKRLSTSKEELVKEAQNIIQNASDPEQAQKAIKPIRRAYKGVVMQEAQLGRNILSRAKASGQEVPEGVPSPTEKVQNELEMFDSTVGSTLTAPQQRQRKASDEFSSSRAQQMGQEAGEGIDVNSQFGAVNTETGDRITALRTNRGLMTQSTDEEGNVQFVPLDSNKIRPIDTQETGTTDELGIGDTEQRQLNDAQVATRNYIGAIGDATELIGENQDINTFVSQGAGVVNSLTQEAEALARNTDMWGIDEPEDQLLKPQQYEGTFKELGIENDKLQSLLTSMAYMQARTTFGESGRLSDTDVQLALRSLGAQSGDPESLRDVLQMNARMAERGFRNNFQVRTGQEFQGNLGTDRLNQNQQGTGGIFPDELPEGVPQGSAPHGVTNDGMPVYQSPDGELMVVE